MSSADYLQALRECCLDDAAFTRLKQLLVSLPEDLDPFPFLLQSGGALDMWI